MNEVHRYKVVTMLSAAGATIGYDPHGPDVVMASAFDEATRLFLDAAERCVASERREKELQQRLTAADELVQTRTADLLECGTRRKQIEERADVLTKALTNVREALGREYWDQYAGLDETRDILDAALKPAEAGADSCEFCKGWGFRANPDGADEGCGACNGTGKEPEEGGVDDPKRI